MRRLRRWIPFMIVLFFGYYIGVTSFPHTHRIFNYSVTHSHPYWPKSNSAPLHTHTDTILGTIAFLNTLNTDLPQVLVVWTSFLLLFIFKLPQIQHLTYRPKREEIGRAPPMYGSL